MIDREQLTAALGRLDSRDRQILDYSLHRRVPDSDLGELFGGTPEEIARMRADAVGRLAKDLGIERGEDLGGLLKDLLDQATWDEITARLAEERRPADDHTGHRPPGVVGSDRSRRDEEGAGATPPAGEPVAGSPPAAEAAESAAEREPGTVLDILSAGERGARADFRRPGPRRLVAAAAVAALILLPAAVVSLTSGSSVGGANELADSGGDRDTGRFTPEEPAGGPEPFPSEPDSAFDYPVAEIDKASALYDKPDGKVKVRIKAKTDWNTKRVMSVVEQRGEWLAVLAPELDNGEVGWIREDNLATVGTVPWAVHVDLSERRLEVRRGGETTRKASIGVGRADHPTPVGRYAVTDKLKVTDPGSPYGCCAVALTGHQTKLPAGWPGGDRLAMHATPDTSGLGKAVSLGCMRMDPKDAAWLMETLPIGAPVFVEQ